MSILVQNFKKFKIFSNEICVYVQNFKNFNIFSNEICVYLQNFKILKFCQMKYVCMFKILKI